MRLMRRMQAVTFWAEILAEKDNLLQTVLKYLFKNPSNQCTYLLIQGPNLCPSTIKEPEINYKETRGQCPAESSAQRIFLEDKEQKDHIESTIPNIFMCLATAYEPLIKIIRFHCLSGFWQVQRVVKVLPKERGRESSTYGCSSTIKWSYFSKIQPYHSVACHQHLRGTKGVQKLLKEEKTHT